MALLSIFEIDSFPKLFYILTEYVSKLIAFRTSQELSVTPRNDFSRKDEFLTSLSIFEIDTFDT